MFRIGEFSKFGRVSVKMLRHYDEIGLLKPARVDPESDYRYYTADQLGALNRILVFKDLGFTLEQIASLLHENLPTDQVLGMLRLKQAQVERELRDQQARLTALATRLRQIESEGRLPYYEVVLKQTEPQLVASIRAQIPRDAEDEGLAELFGELERHALRHHARLAAARQVIYHACDHDEEHLMVEALVPLRLAAPETRRVRVYELPGVATMASVVHAGEYCALGLACRALNGWIEAQGYRVSGPWREVHLRHPADPALGLPEAFVAGQRGDQVLEFQLPVEVA